jgi:quinol monooxygenase YgiN
MLMRRRLGGICLSFGLLAVIWNTNRVAGQDKENPVITAVKSRLKDPDKPFTLIVRIKLKEGAGKDFEASFAKASLATRKEEGNLAYDLNRDTQDPSRYLIYERWKNLAALEAHLKTSYIKALLAELPKVADGAPESQILLPAGE